MDPNEPVSSSDLGATSEQQQPIESFQEAVDGQRILKAAIAAISHFRVFADQTWVCDYCSSGCEAVYGYSARWLAGHPKQWLSRIVSDDRQSRLPRVLEDIFLERSSATELRFLHRDGTLRWLWVTIASQRQEARDCWQVTVVATDITPYKRIEETVRASEEQFCWLAHNAPVFLWMMDADAQMTFVNQSWLDFTGQPPEAELGQGWMTQIHPEDRQGSLESMADAFRHRQPFHIEYRHRRADGEYRWIVNTGVPRFAADERFAGYVGSCLDISDRKQAELMTQEAMAREQQIRERERFIAVIAQNVRQSLDLHQILITTVEEVRQFLEVDRVLIYRFKADWRGEIVAEAVTDPSYSILDRTVDDDCFTSTTRAGYQQGRIHTVNHVQLADLDPCYVNFLSTLQVRAVLAIPILVRQELWGLLIAHDCTGPRQWQQVSWYLLRQLSIQVAIGIYQAELYQQTQQQAQKERILNRVTQTIRNSLDLPQIFAAATAEISQLLALDRAEIVQYLPEQGLWRNVASHRRTPDLPDAFGLTLVDDEHPFAARLRQLEVIQVVLERVHPPAEPPYPGTWLHIPLQSGPSVWGSFSLNRPSHWPWQEWEVELARAVADQLAIAIQQCHLYQAVQQLNLELEQQVQVRTVELHQSLEFEALLKRITDKVRDSLDENQILQTAVEELGQGLEIVCCNTGIYDATYTTSTISHEYTVLLPPAQGQVIPLSQFADLYCQLLNRQLCQFCLVESGNERSVARNYSILVCPIFDDHGILGDLCLFKQRDQVFSDLEMRIVQQVANQCAIALRQSRLYQASQAQVREWERLNHLKDDFLSTVSHELRTPMANIKMAIQMMEMLLFTPANRSLQSEESSQVPAVYSLPVSSFQRLNRYFQILQEECQREILLINNLLDLSPLDAEMEPLTPVPLELQQWFPPLIDSFMERALRHQQQLQLQLPDGLPPLTIALSYLERIVIELLDNACKYTPAGEQIIVSAQILRGDHRPKEEEPGQASLFPAFHPHGSPPLRHQPAWLHLRVVNTGVEIPEQERDRIFEKFYRIPNSDPWKHGGTGLGLALVKKLSTRLGASIRLGNETGQTAFILDFPCLIAGTIPLL